MNSRSSRSNFPPRLCPQSKVRKLHLQRRRFSCQSELACEQSDNQRQTLLATIEGIEFNHSWLLLPTDLSARSSVKHLDLPCSPTKFSCRSACEASQTSRPPESSKTPAKPLCRCGQMLTYIPSDHYTHKCESPKKKPVNIDDSAMRTNQDSRTEMHEPLPLGVVKGCNRREQMTKLLDAFEPPGRKRYDEQCNDPKN